MCTEAKEFKCSLLDFHAFAAPYCGPRVNSVQCKRVRTKEDKRGCIGHMLIWEKLLTRRKGTAHLCPWPMSGLKGTKVAEGQIRCSRILNIDRGLHAEFNQSPRSRKIVPGVHAFGTDGRLSRAREPKKQHLSRGSRVKTYSDICFGGHSIPTQINVLPPFNFTSPSQKQTQLEGYYFALPGSVGDRSLDTTEECTGKLFPYFSPNTLGTLFDSLTCAPKSN